MRTTLATVLACLTVVPATAQELAIAHDPVACVVAERFPLFEARIAPPDSVARAKVHFRTATDKPWYTVAMKADGPVFRATLPKPKKGLQSFRYYVEAIDRRFGSSRTDEQTAAVVPDAVSCQGKMVAGMGGTAGAVSIVLETAAGAPVVPVGFAPTGVTGATATAGTAGAAGAAAGGGVGIGTIAAIVGGGAAVAGAVVVAKGGDGGSEETSAGGGGGTGPGGSSPGGGGGAPSRIYHISFSPSPPGLDVSVCAGKPLNWSSQVVSSATGQFDTTWAPNEPNTLRVSGTVTDTAFSATIACTSGAATGGLSANGSGGTYQGSFTLGSQRGSISIRRE